ncbi:hypothetical protein CALK_0444 [Chitinivibrio alkaliphilus ACht1]|uniref:Uncharacterized protein n=2 Tax=Chitinivibrio TaxID=1505231 RepID=U7D7M6_9BACT|nr:hypothetical protein CALK_0444 [Chitinivibrio alkaliphilus ACht1]
MILCAGILFLTGGYLYGAGTMNTRGLAGVSRTLSTYPLGQGLYHFGGSAKFDIAPEGVETDAGTERVVSLSQSLFWAYGLNPSLDVSMELPFYQDFWDGREDDRAGLGDLAVAMKLQHPGFKENAPFTFAYHMVAHLPTGSSDKGVFPRHSYYTTKDSAAGNQAFTGEAWRLAPSMVWSIDLARRSNPLPMRIHGNLGASVAVHTPDKNNLYNMYSAAIGAVALEYDIEKDLTLFTELSGEFRIGHFIEGFSLTDFNNDRVLFSLGGTRYFPRGMYLTSSADIGVSSRQHSTPWEITDDAGAPLVYETRAVPEIGVNFTFGRYGRKMKSPVKTESHQERQDIQPIREEPREKELLSPEENWQRLESHEEEIEEQEEQKETEEISHEVSLADINETSEVYTSLLDRVAQKLIEDELHLVIMAYRDGVVTEEPAEWARRVGHDLIDRGVDETHLILRVSTVRDREESEQTNHRVILTFQE